MLHMLYFQSYFYLMYYIVSEIWIGGHFLEDCFYCYSEQINSDVANDSLMPYNLIKRAAFSLGGQLQFINLKFGTHTK